MANNTDNERFWTLDTVAVIAAVGVETVVRKIVYYPSAIDDDVVIQEYLPSGTLATGMKLKANHTDVNLVSLDFGCEGRRLNGFKLSTIDGGSLEVYVGNDKS